MDPTLFAKIHHIPLCMQFNCVQMYTANTNPLDHHCLGHQQISSFSGSSQAASSWLSAFVAAAVRTWRKTVRKVPSPNRCNQQVLNHLPFGWFEQTHDTSLCY
jgi:hypothetical protein